jgi:hypothetical protein
MHRWHNTHWTKPPHQPWLDVRVSWRFNHVRIRQSGQLHMSWKPSMAVRRQLTHLGRLSGTALRWYPTNQSTNKTNQQDQPTRPTNKTNQPTPITRTTATDDSVRLTTINNSASAHRSLEWQRRCAQLWRSEHHIGGSVSSVL